MCFHQKKDNAYRTVVHSAGAVRVELTRQRVTLLGGFQDRFRRQSICTPEIRERRLVTTGNLI